MSAEATSNETFNNLKGNIKRIPIPDKTLTKEGVAADAKTVGDAIAELNKRIDALMGGNG